MGAPEIDLSTLINVHDRLGSDQGLCKSQGPFQKIVRGGLGVNVVVLRSCCGSGRPILENRSLYALISHILGDAY